MASADRKNIIVTTALPYANGEVHIGHLLEHVQADIWTRSLRMEGHDAHLLSADDTHGTPIMIRAREDGITPEQLIAKAAAEHVADFRDFEVHHAIYSSTNSPENKALCEEFYSKMKSKGHIDVRPVEQLFCPHDKMFLPDRFVVGTCPKCSSPNQYGDSCDVCGSTYNPSELKNPACYICGTAPVKKSSDHYFFKLNDFKQYLIDWLPKHTAEEVGNKMMEWFKEDLRDWDISRDEPYFGFAIPGAPGKFFYVWVDAPMGYVSTTKVWAAQNGRNFDDYWRREDFAEVYHFIGKDITYFHTLFWPALLKSADFRTPTRVCVHGFLTVNGEKMSKSKGTMMPIRVYLNHLNPMYLRYYYATKLNSHVEDLDLNMDDFVQRVNSDLVGKITNLASRGAQMLQKKFGGQMTAPEDAGLALITRGQGILESVAKHFHEREFSKALTELRTLADEANRYFDEKAPWKAPASEDASTQQVLTTTLNLFRLLAIGLTGVMPEYGRKSAELFNEGRAGTEAYHWEDAKKVLANVKVREYQHLASRIDPLKIKDMLAESVKVNAELAEKRAKARAASLPKAAKSAQPAGAPATASAATASANTAAKPAATAGDSTGMIEIDDFMKIDLRIGKVVSAEEIPEANKLLRLQIDIGEEKPRQIIAGIKASYKAADLAGRSVLVVANLKPRQMKFGMSEGMVLAASNDQQQLFVLSPDQGAAVGSRVK